MIGLVLQAAGKFTVAGDHDRISMLINTGHHGMFRTMPDRADAWNAQAPLQPLLLAVQLGEHRIDDVPEIAVQVVREDREARADLIRGQARAAWFLDGVEQVGHQPCQRVVEPGHPIAGGAQYRIAELPDGPDGNDAALGAGAAPIAGAPGSLGGTGTLSAVSWPARLSTIRCQASSASMRSLACSRTRSSATVWSGQVRSAWCANWAACAVSTRILSTTYPRSTPASRSSLMTRARSTGSGRSPVSRSASARSARSSRWPSAVIAYTVRAGRLPDCSVRTPSISPSAASRCSAPYRDPGRTSDHRSARSIRASRRI